MSNEYSGYWVGTIAGTNQGGFTLELKQEGIKVEGIAAISESSLGQYKYRVIGTVSDNLSLSLTPVWQSGGINLGNAVVIASLLDDGSLTGRWSSDIGTEGIISATKHNDEAVIKTLPKNNSVFIVHGHDEGLKQAVARYLEKIGLEPVILHEQINSGMTIIEKFEDFAKRAGFAVVLMTPDDYGYPKENEAAKKARPRQNVVLELGYFVAKLGRSKTLVLTRGDLELPSDFSGVVYESVDNGDGWKMRLAQELKSAGFKIDLNNALN